VHLSTEAEAYLDNFRRCVTGGGDIKRAVSVARRHWPPDAWEALQAYFPEHARQADDDAKNRMWWEERVERFAKIPNHTERWREVTGMIEVLTSPSAYPRPYLVEKLRTIAHHAAMAGADTDPTKVYRASSAMLDTIERMIRQAAEAKKAPSAGAPGVKA